MTYNELSNFWVNAGERDEQGWEVEPLKDAQSNLLCRHINLPLKNADFAWSVADRKFGYTETQFNTITSPVMWRFYNIMAKKIQKCAARRKKALSYKAKWEYILTKIDLTNPLHLGMLDGLTRLLNKDSDDYITE